MAHQVNVTEDFFIGSVSGVVSEMLTALQGNQELVIDLSAVIRIDSAAIQALLSAKKEAESLGVAVTFKQSDTVRSFAASVGVSL